MLPNSIATPSQDTPLNCSPTRKTPSIAAVNGSAKDRVTAVDEFIFANRLRTVNKLR